MQLIDVGKRIQTDVSTSLGERLALLRKAAGFTQVELPAELGISHRMVAHCERLAATPPAHLLPQISAALGVSMSCSGWE